MNSFDYTILKDFCKVRNHGTAMENGLEPTPRMLFIMELLDKMGIEYKIDTYTHESVTEPRAFGFTESEEKLLELSIEEIELVIQEKTKSLRTIQREMFESHNTDYIPAHFTFYNESTNELRKNFYTAEMDIFLYQDVLMYKRKQKRLSEHRLFNIVLPGTSSTMFIAHHDVKNSNVDNCNDNSASVINLIALKQLMPEATIVFTDAEELGGLGADRLAKMIKAGEYGYIRWVVNLELTAMGTNLIVGRKRNSLFQYIQETFTCESFDDSQVKSDASILHEKGIQCVVLTTLPTVNGKSDFSIIKNCHTNHDTINLANYTDMQNFVEKILVKLVL